jgi:hypothetical protein
MYNANYPTQVHGIPPYQQTRMRGAVTKIALKLNQMPGFKTLLVRTECLEGRQWEEEEPIMREPITMIKDTEGDMMQ